MSTHSTTTSAHPASNTGAPARARGNSVADCSKGTSLFTGKQNTELGDFSGSKSVDKSTPISEADDIPKETTEDAPKKPPSRTPAIPVKSGASVFATKPKPGSSTEDRSSSLTDGSNADPGEWVSITKEDLDEAHQDNEKQDQGKKYGAAHSSLQGDVCAKSGSWTNPDWPKPFGER